MVGVTVAHNQIAGAIEFVLRQQLIPLMPGLSRKHASAVGIHDPLPGPHGRLYRRVANDATADHRSPSS